MSAPLYEQIADEVSHGQIDRGLWLEAYAASLGNEELARAQYIKLRVRRLRGLGFLTRRAPGAGGSRRDAAAAAGPGRRGWFAETCAGAAADLWTGWLWAWTHLFAALTAVGVLCLGCLLILRLWDDGVIAWPFFTVGCGFLTCFLFGRGVQRLVPRPPTAVFYAVELGALGAAIFLVARVTTNPTFLGRIPHALGGELVFLLVRFLHADPLSNALTVAVFFLPVYGVIAFARQQKI